MNNLDQNQLSTQAPPDVGTTLSTAGSGASMHAPGLALTIVMPVYNEAESLPALFAELVAALFEPDLQYEILAVDDGSRDDSVPELRRLQEDIPQLKIVQLRRNFGQTAAFAAGFDLAQGATVVTLDADGQNDPADMPALLAELEGGGYDMVNGWRQNRKEPFLTRRLPSMIANALIGSASSVPLHDRGCSLRVYRCELAREIRLYGEMHRFIRAPGGAHVNEQIASLIILNDLAVGH